MAHQNLVRLANTIDASLEPTLSYKVLETSISNDIVVQKVRIRGDGEALICYMPLRVPESDPNEDSQRTGVLPLDKP